MTYESGVGVDLMLISPKEHKINYSLWFGFKASNNEDGYKAWLHLANEMKGSTIHICIHSLLVVYYISTEYQARRVKMAAYLSQEKKLVTTFSKSLVD